MFTATVIVSLFLAVALTVSGVGKLRGMPQVVESIERVGVPRNRFAVLAGLEFAGALGLVVGLFWAPLGIAAAIGVVLYFLGAIGAHLRVADRGFGPALFLLAVAVAALVLRSVTA